MAMQDELERNVDVLNTTEVILRGVLHDLVGPSPETIPADRASDPSAVGTLNRISNLTDNLAGLARTIAEVVNNRSMKQQAEEAYINEGAAKARAIGV